MEAVGLLLTAVGCGLAVLWLLPVRMRVHTRATLIALSIFSLSLGFSLYDPTAPSSRVAPNQLACVSVLATLAAIAVGLGTAWRLKWEGRRWQSHWKYVLRSGFIREYFKRYCDIDDP